MMSRSPKSNHFFPQSLENAVFILSWCCPWCLCSFPYEPHHDKTNKMTVRPATTQISLGIRPVWSESLLCPQWVAKDPSLLHADSEDWSDWVFAGCHFVGFVMRQLVWWLGQDVEFSCSWSLSFHLPPAIWYEPEQEIMVLFILHKLILQMRMCSHPVGLDVWFLVGLFVNFNTSSVRTVKALARLRGCAGSLEPSLVAYA